MTEWIETYRGTVNRWEIDNVGHFTVAYYFDRLSDATLNLLATVGLGVQHTLPGGRACHTTDCYVRYQQELRVGDILHVVSGVLSVDDDGLALGHKMFNSETGALCTTFEQRVRYVALETCAPLALPGVARKAAEAARVTWDGPAREHRPRPAKLDGFVDTVRDTVKPSEIDVTGQCSLEHHVHRFSAANAQILGALGLTPAYMRDQHRGYSTFEFQFAQTGALRAGASVRVRTGVLHIGNSSIRLLHRMFDAGRGEEVASLEQFGVLLDTDARRPTPLSDDLREKARALLIRS